MTNTPELTFVIPARNNRGIISATLLSISRQTFRNFACLVVDGRSTDGTPQHVRENFPWVTVVTKDADSGPGVSRTLGLLQSRSPYIALVDSDVQLSPDWAESQLRFIEQNRKTGIVASRVLYGKNHSVLYSAFGAMNRYGVSWDGGQGDAVEAHLEPRRCLWANTSAIMVRREVVETAGAFDDRMFACCEDSDFGWRANLCGFDTFYNPGAIAVHDVHGSFNPSRDKDLFIYLLRRNRLRSLLVNYEFASLLRFALPYVGLSILDICRSSGRWPKLKALFWNLRILPDTLRRRTQVQGLRRVKDSELWPLFEKGIRGPGGDAMVRLEKSMQI